MKAFRCVLALMMAAYLCVPATAFADHSMQESSQASVVQEGTQVFLADDAGVPESDVADPAASGTVDAAAMPAAADDGSTEPAAAQSGANGADEDPQQGERTAGEEGASGNDKASASADASASEAAGNEYDPASPDTSSSDAKPSSNEEDSVSEGKVPGTADASQDAGEKAAAESAGIAQDKGASVSAGTAAADGASADDIETNVGVQAVALAAPAASSKPLKAPANPTPIYVNGASGDDANAGTAAAPVKTFAKAKELMEASGGEIIYVSGALQATGDAGTWDLGGKTLARGDDYHGDLVKVLEGSILTLTNIVLDGRSDEGQDGVASVWQGGGGSLVSVVKGILTIGDGAILQDNTVRNAGHWYPEAGGAVYAQGDGAVVNMEGGIIRNNSAVNGGGIYGCMNAVINMSGGSITGNRAVDYFDGAKSATGGSGGGICVFDGADINFYGGTISGNSAYERGGGISVGTSHAPTGQSILVMHGGTISDNTAGCAGGGIFLQYGDNSSYSIADIIGGDIINNAMTGKGDGNKSFGGGGIYVNGIGSQYTDWHDAELHIENLEVAYNSAAIRGGGYAACPSSSTELFLTNGAVFHDNEAGNGANELFIQAGTGYGTHSGSPSYEISPSMLGGGAYRWTYDSGSEVPLNDLKGRLSSLFGQQLSLNNALSVDDASVQEGIGLAKVRILGNTSVTRGGGIGSNGSVYIGPVTSRSLLITVEAPVVKTWDDGDDKEGIRPASIQVELYRNGEYVSYQTMKPGADGTWTTTFKNLPACDEEGNDYVYTVKEREVPGYSAAITGSAQDGFTISNILAVSVSGTKVWEDANDQDGKRPDAVTINLLRDGQKLESKTVGENDNWSYIFQGLAKYGADGHEYAYSVSEDFVEGYASSVTGDAANGFTVTNSHTPESTSVSVVKSWVGGEGYQAIVRLFADGVDTGKELVLNVANAWKGLFADLPKYKDGRLVSYTVAEDAVEGYTSAIEGDAENGFTVVNTKEETPEEPEGPTPEEPEGPTPEEPEGPAPDEPMTPASAKPTQPQQPAGPVPATGDGVELPLALAVLVSAGAAMMFAARRLAK